jgi:hypothetical protein
MNFVGKKECFLPGTLLKYMVSPDRSGGLNSRPIAAIFKKKHTLDSAVQPEEQETE